MTCDVKQKYPNGTITNNEYWFVNNNGDTKSKPN